MNVRMNHASSTTHMRSIALVAAGLLAGCGGGGGKSPGDGGVDGDGSTPVWVGVIGTGQSLSVGAASNGLVFTTPSPGSYKLALGARETTWPIDATDPELSLVAVAEPIRTINTTSYSAPYPINIYGETFHSAMAAQLDTINRAAAGAGGGVGGVGLTSVHSVVGQGDSSITVIRKGGTGNAYAASLFEASALTRLVAAAGARYEVFAVMLTHGEKDAELPSYELIASETPTNVNPLGVKGIGEAGTIGATPAIQNAVIDAVAHLGVRHIDMPTTPQRVWTAINEAQKASNQ